MSLHKLSAGSGYDYLTRQVAVQDSTEKGHQGLTTYYSEQGETPGTWVGRGCEGIGDNFAGSQVTAEQMQLLFGAGQHPLGHERAAKLGADASERDLLASYRLGASFKVPSEVSNFRVDVARRVAEWNTSHGLEADARVPGEVRAGIRSQVAAEFFVREMGRPHFDARELAGAVARYSRPGRSVVSGFDLTFSPPKSVSTLWAIADLPTAAMVERAHHDAVAEALRFVEDHLLYTREGAKGVRQVDVDGLVGAAFTHRDSRAGDPDLHTHVAVANKVRATGSGKWLAIDARLLYQGVVAASETYNTTLYKRLEAHGLRFENRAMGAGKRPVREVVGVPAELNERWSSRRRAIEQRRGELASAFQDDHGRPPTVVEGYDLAQRATLETQDAKHAPRTITEQRAAWRAEAIDILGSPQAITHVVHSALHPAQAQDLPVADSGWFDAATARVVAAMERRGATWRRTDVRAEAQRQVRLTATPSSTVDAAIDLLTAMALEASVPLEKPTFGITEPQPLRRSDGSSVYTVAGSTLFTSHRILHAEQDILALADTDGGTSMAQPVLEASLAMSAAERGFALNAGQAALVEQLATSGRLVQLAIAPAGSGKTTAMHALAAAWESSGHTVVGLAPSAAAASQLSTATGLEADTLAKLAWGITHDQLPHWAQTITTGSMVIIDEAGMADTLTLATVTGWATSRGAVVRLIGDDQQLAAIGSGGLLRDIQTRHGAATLDELMRFTDPAEAAASLALRQGDTAAIGFYLDNDRVHVGDLATVTDNAFTTWTHDKAAGRDAIMLAPTRDLVAELNHRAQTHHLGPHATGPSAALADGNHARIGDIVITRRNDRRLSTSRTDWVKNGDRWHVMAIHPDGSLSVQHHQSRRRVTVPADYVIAAVELGYATTVHAAQGISADVTHGIATPDESRQQLYTMLTRGKHANHLWLQTTGDGDPALLTQPDATTPPTPTDLLEQILTRDDAARSATTQHADHHDPARLLADAVATYTDGITTAAEHLLGPRAVATIEAHAETLEPGITDEPAWPALRNHLILIASNGTNPLTALTAAHAQHELDDARDKAATLAWRLDLRHPLTAGPLPWLPGIPTRVHDDPAWGTWAQQRAILVATLADQVARLPFPDATWAALPCTDETRRQLAIWRAANAVPDTDPRPTGPRQTTRQATQYQRALDHAIDQNDPALERWKPILEVIGERLTHDPALVRLAHRLDDLSATGHDVHGILADTITVKPLPDDHPAAALLWRLTRTTTPETTQNTVPTIGEAAVELPGPDDPVTRLALLGMVRNVTGPTPPSDAMLRHQLDRADALADSPVPAERLHQVNQLAQNYYASQLQGSWAQPYLAERLGVDLTGHPTIQPGHAPAGWTNLATHLRRHGVTDLEMLTAGLVKPASTGNLIDRFRDRLTLPITNHDGYILGFVARANPTLPADQAGPKYLNTPTTPIYSKGDQFYGHPQPGSTPVIVEGPLDAIAITLATAGRHTGLAPLGTSLTDHQAALLANQERVVLATDNDPAGNTAADKDHFKLAVHRTYTLRAELPAGSDPAELLITHGPAALTRCLDNAKPTTDRLINSADDDAVDQALSAIAAAHPSTWQQGLEGLSQQTRIPEEHLQARLVPLVQAWNDTPRAAAADATAQQRGHIQRTAINARYQRGREIPKWRPTTVPRR
ncbi:DNA primase catalytic core [Luteococcus japonicus]|uniref:DNA primase catalytic core n=1 Tax=Luteococcus japonicus TaxID=33984 RepID=A0A3N1ZR77_9ACTN|nr:MobF family relaxase [Luteococcus japonicus]ROR53399.1 DNA primase catalytic core [Luteococcus japonicus]